MSTTLNYKKTKCLCFAVIIVFLCSISFNAWSVTVADKQKYHSLLTEDYGILNLKDLIYATSRMSPRPFVEKNSGAYKYWQCFPRENISMTLEDVGYSSEDFGWKDTIGDMLIRVCVSPGVFHEYGMRQAVEFEKFQKEFSRLRKLMKGQKYVCIAGNFIDRKQTLDSDGVRRDISGWFFDRLKTKKGCAAYLNATCDY